MLMACVEGAGKAFSNPVTFTTAVRRQVHSLQQFIANLHLT